MTRAAFLTLEERGSFVIDDALAISELGRRGWQVDEVPWTRDAAWDTYACAVVRTTWDYQQDPPRFLAALDRIAAATRLWNPVEVIGWNLHKSYLGELARRGVAVVPTTYGRGHPPAVLPGRHVLKPVVSANADDTFVVDGGVAPDVAARFAGREWMLQPFVPSVLAEGEHSLFYFADRYSHAVVKRPQPGDFRVQEEHGGAIAAETPAGDLRAAADAVIAAVGQTLLQARVDLVRLEDGTPALMELELIEPSLYFRMDPGAAGRFADALLELTG